MKILTKIIKFIIMTILAVSIISIGIITIVSSTILNQEYMQNKLEETNFYKETYELVTSNFENYIYQSGLDESVLENICTEEKVKKDLNIILSNIYEGKQEKIDIAEISNKLNKNIEDSGVKTNQNASAIDQFVEKICNEYTQTIIHTNYEDKIHQGYIKIEQAILKAERIFIVTSIISVIILLIMNIKQMHKFVQNIGISLGASGIFYLVICSIIKSKVNIKGIKIFNDTFSKAIVAIIQEVLSNIQKTSYMLIGIALVLIAIYAVVMVQINKNKEQMMKKEEEIN